MLDEVIANQLESLPFYKFRDLSRHLIEELGYGTPTTSDGWADGGRDLRVHGLGNLQPARLAIQISVEWTWKSKLLEDVGKADKKLGCHTFIYVTNRRIADAEFQPYITRVLANGIHLSKLDKQDIARRINDDDELRLWFADFMEYPERTPNTKNASLREEAACAFVLFSDKAQEFRSKIFERAIMVRLLHEKEGISRSQLVADSIELLGLSGPSMKAKIGATIDKLMQRRIVRNRDKVLTLAESQRQRYLGMQRIADAEWKAFNEELQVKLSGYLPAKSDKQVAAAEVAKNIGKVIHAYRDYQVSLLQEKPIESAIRTKHQKAISNVKSLLHQEGVPVSKMDECMRDLSDLEGKHPIIARVTAGEVFCKLLTANESVLMKALGRHRKVSLILEPSVMIPLLCTKLFGEVKDLLSRGGLRLFDAASHFQFPIFLPDVYLEECASHLIFAGRYQPIVEQQPLETLRYSENAFVAFFACLNDKKLKFSNFLRLFGYAGEASDFDAHRDGVQIALTRILGRYGIQVTRYSWHKVQERVRKSTEVELSHIYRQLGIEKPPVLVKHDLTVLQYVRTAPQDDQEARVLITWDKALITACQQDKYDWWCLDPVHAADLFALVNSTGPNEMGIQMALHLDNSDLRRASQVWDALVQIERDNLQDAELMRLAASFKETYLTKQADNQLITSQIRSAWAQWKVEKLRERQENKQK